MSQLLENLQTLKLRIEQGIPAPTSKPKLLSMKDIVCIEDVFQPRKIVAYKSEQHIAGMVKTLRSNKAKRLEPILVFWIGDTWCCIDGHHRLKAYGEANITKSIPVSIFTDSLPKARLQAFGRNSRDKLPMMAEDKSNGAWRLVATSSDITLTKELIADATGISPRTVGYMREARRKLDTITTSHDYADISWKEARLMAEGITLNKTETDYENFIEQDGQKKAAQFRRHFGDRLGKNPDSTAYALYLYDSSLIKQMLPYLRDLVAEEVDEFDIDDEDTEVLEGGVVDPVI